MLGVMSTGLFDWLGAEQNLTVLAGRAWERELEFVDTTDGGREGMDVSDVTFDGVVTGADGSEVGIEVSHRDSGEGSLLLVVFPALEAGVYRWELRAVDDSGEKRRMIYGRLGVLATRLDLEREASDEVEAQRMMVKVPGRDARRIMAEWRATTRALRAAGEASAAAGEAGRSVEAAEGYAAAAAGSAQEAAESAAGAREAVDGAAAAATAAAAGYAAAAAGSAQEAAAAAAGVRESAKEIAQEATEAARERLEGMIEETEGTRKRAEVTVQKLEVFMASFGENVRSVVWVDPETGHLIIGGVDTLAKVTGEPGKSPYVDEAGDWQYWDDESEQWRNGGPARGEDGFSPYLDAEGYLVYRDVLSGEVVRSAQPLKGRDGINGGNVRRILVERVEDIPQEGETCNGGVYYYVPNVDDMPRAVIEVLAEGRRESDRLVVDGTEVALPGAELGPEEAAGQLAGNIEAGCSWLRAEAEGSKVKLYTVDERRQTLTVNRSGDGYAVTEVPMEDREGYHVFAWVEVANGGASWVRVGMANDVATKEVYGLTKLGTDVVVAAGGAPVGVNEAGEMAVPHADYTTAGAMLPSAEETLGSGDGEVGFDESGRARVPQAGYKKSGVVSLSWRGEAQVGVIGAMADGTLGTMWATLNQAGVICLGSQFGQGNPLPYRVGIGADEGHHLANNLVYGGAYKHMSPAGWRSLALPWLDAVMDEHPEWFEDAYYSGLHSSVQFFQSAENGLELLSATETLKAGVYLAVDIASEEREDAVPTARTVREWVHAECYTRAQVDNKLSNVNTRIGAEVSELGRRIESERDTINKRIESERDKLGKRIDSEVQGLNDTMRSKEEGLSERIEANKEKFGEYTDTKGMKKYVADELAAYEKTNMLLGRDYATNTRVTELDGQNIKCTDGVQRIYVLAPEEFEASRGSRDKKGLYIKATM